jgi:hypothetical protein
MGYIPAIFLVEYDSILSSFKATGLDIAGFEIPYAGDDEGCDKAFFSMKLKGIILHLSEIGPANSHPDTAVYDRLRLAFDPAPVDEDDEVPF